MAVVASYDNNGKVDTQNLAKNLSQIEGLKYINNENQEVNVLENTEIKLTAKFKLNGYNYKISDEGKVTNKKEGAIENEDIMKSPSTYYGKYVTNYNSLNDAGIKYTDGQTSKWQIFLADENNIYLISADAISEAYVPLNYNSNSTYYMWFSNILSMYNTDNQENPSVSTILQKLNNKNEYFEWISNATLENRKNQQAVLSMLDTDKWNEYTDAQGNKKGYKNATFADYVIGGPTIEMFCKAYNITHEGFDISAKPKNSNGYYRWGYKIKKEKEGEAEDTFVTGLKASGQTQINDDVNNMLFKCSYWLASPSNFDVIYLAYVTSGNVTRGFCDNNAWSCFRPLVCLKSNVHLVQKTNGSTTTYELELD